MDMVLAGFGTVGQGFARVLTQNRERIERSLGKELRVVGVFDSRSYSYDPKGLDTAAMLERKAAGLVGERTIEMPTPELLDGFDYDLLIEATPTNIEDGGPAMEHIRRALSTSRHVITCNKGPLALRFRELADMADRKGVSLRFEGAVGGAMPVVNVARETLAGEGIRSIKGIFNGTCNFILHRMGTEGLPFEHVLKEAQQLGYAETDPTYDIEGVDSACKVAILANSIFGKDVTVHDVHRVGITTMNDAAVGMAREQGKVIRLIGEVSDDRLEVTPRLVPMGHPLAVGGTLNIAQIDAEFAGPITVAGRGAGSLETASALLSDLMALMRINR